MTTVNNPIIKPLKRAKMNKGHTFIMYNLLLFSVPARARTVDPLIKSQLLYQLSYRDESLDLDGKIRGKHTNSRKISRRLPAERDFSPKLATGRKL